MIDIHCHMLPGIDDGARDLKVALQMARLAVDDGITLTVCTPHIYPGVFENTHEGIREATAAFQRELDTAGIPLKLAYGADIQIVPELVEGLRDGRLPTINGSRYFLFEPPHHIVPPGMLDLIHSCLAASYVPIITHPERLTYVDSFYDQFVEAHRMGAWIQLTGGSLLGVWGPRVKKMTERFLKDGITHIIASDGHNLKNRTPTLLEAKSAASRFLAAEEVERLFHERPQQVVTDQPVDAVTAPGAQWTLDRGDLSERGWFRRLFG